MINVLQDHNIICWGGGGGLCKKNYFKSHVSYDLHLFQQLNFVFKSHNPKLNN